jgi:hypothetical protein
VHVTNFSKHLISCNYSSLQICKPSILGLFNLVITIILSLIKLFMFLSTNCFHVGVLEPISCFQYFIQYYKWIVCPSMKPKFATTYIVIGDGWNIEAFFNYKLSCYIDVEL